MTQISPSSAILSPREAALILFGTDKRSKVQHLRSLLQKGVIKGYQFQGRWYITATEIERITDGGAALSDYTA